MAGLIIVGGNVDTSSIAPEASFEEMVLSAALILWKQLGTELAIFAITLVLALIVRNTQGKQVAKKSCSSSTFVSADQKTNVDKQVRRRAAIEPRSNVVPVNCAIPVFAVGGASNMRVADNRTRSPGESDTTTWQREPWHIVDEICASMQSDSRLAVAARNVELYCELQHVLKAKGSTIMEATWYARYSSFDLYTCMVQCVVRTSQYHLVECLIRDMAQHGIARPLSFYEAAMKQLAGRKQYQLAMDVYKHLAADGLTPSNITYSCLVSFAAELGEYDKALSFFGKLSAKTTPSIRAYMTVLRVHGKRQDWPASLATFREMQQRGLTLDNLVLNVVLATGIAADNVEEVDALVAEGDVAMPTPITDVVSYNTLVKGYLQRNDLTTAVGILDRMQHRGIKPNAITFNTMMERAARSHNNALAWSLLEKMRSFGVKPDRLTCSSLVRALGKHSLPQQIQDCTNLLVEATLADGRSCCDAPLLSHLQDIVLDAATACACQEPQLLADVRKAFKR